jgi:hypothetical protein
MDYEQQALVCVVTHPADLERAGRGWYRIPVARAPRGLAAEYLAFYLTAAFGEQRWSIRSIAAVQAVRLAQRAELLPEEPLHPRASQRYYCFELGALQDLPAPIPSRRLRRTTFIPTTISALLAARDVSQLRRASQAELPDVWGAGIGRRAVIR